MSLEVTNPHIQKATIEIRNYIFVKSRIFPLILFIIMPVVTIFICSFDSTKKLTSLVAQPAT